MEEKDRQEQEHQQAEYEEPSLLDIEDFGDASGGSICVTGGNSEQVETAGS